MPTRQSSGLSSETTHSTKVKVQLEWILPNADKIIQRAKENVETVGYSSINLYGSGAPTRRKWGSTSKEEEIDLGLLKLKDGSQKSESKSESNSELKESPNNELMKTKNSKGKEFLQNLLDAKKRPVESIHTPNVPNKRKRFQSTSP